MTKKKFVILLILPITGIVLALMTYVIRVTFFAREYVTSYDSSYYDFKDNWWIFLIFIPLCLVSLVLGIKYKHRVIITVSSVLAAVLAVCSFAFVRQMNNYSTSTKDLEKIEERINFDFPNSSKIIMTNYMFPTEENDKDIKKKKAQYILKLII